MIFTIWETAMHLHTLVTAHNLTISGAARERFQIVSITTTHARLQKLLVLCRVVMNILLQHLLTNNITHVD